MRTCPNPLSANTWKAASISRARVSARRLVTRTGLSPVVAAAVISITLQIASHNGTATDTLPHRIRKADPTQGRPGAWTLMSSWWVQVWPALVATHELTRQGKKVAVLDQENEANLGGQAFWSFGGPESAPTSSPGICRWPTRSARTFRCKASATRGARARRSARHIVTRKTLGGIQTDLESRAMGNDGQPIPGLYSAGQVAGFGGGGVHGYNALEGTFLGGCIFSGRAAGRAAATAV